MNCADTRKFQCADWKQKVEIILYAKILYAKIECVRIKVEEKTFSLFSRCFSLLEYSPANFTLLLIYCRANERHKPLHSLVNLKSKINASVMRTRAAEIVAKNTKAKRLWNEISLAHGENMQITWNWVVFRQLSIFLLYFRTELWSRGLRTKFVNALLRPHAPNRLPLSHKSQENCNERTMKR